MFDFETFFKGAEEEQESISFCKMLDNLGYQISPVVISEGPQFFIFRIWIDSELYYFKAFTTGHMSIDPHTFLEVDTYCTTRIQLLNHPYYVTYKKGVEAWNELLAYFEDNTGRSIVEDTHGFITYQEPIPNAQGSALPQV